MESDEKIDLQFKNWDKYNGRKDIKKKTWFRMEAAFFFDPVVASLSHSHIVAMLWLLSRHCVATQLPITVKIRDECKFIRIKAAKFLQIIRDLEACNIIEVCSKTRTDTFLDENRSVTDANGSVLYGRTNERTNNMPADCAAECLDLFELWNANCGSLPKAKSMTKKRAAAVRARLKEKSDRDYWQSVISEMAQSDFCNGKNSQGWTASFDFLIKPDTHVKVSEGKYKNNNISKENKNKIDSKLQVYEGTGDLL